MTSFPFEFGDLEFIASDIPKDDIPKDDFPKDDFPKDDFPKDDFPKDDFPKDDFPKDDFPKDDLSKFKQYDALGQAPPTDTGLDADFLGNQYDALGQAPPTDTGLDAAPSKKKKRTNNVPNKTSQCTFCFRTMHYFGLGRHEKCCLQNPDSKNTIHSLSTVIGLNGKPIRLFTGTSRQPGHKWCPHCTFYHSVYQQPFCPENK
jgi:hypothetical protein